MKLIVFFIVCISLIPAAFADVNVPDGNTQLTQAAKDSNLPAGQTEHKEDKFPLHMAASDGDIEKVKKLIAEGYNVNIQDDANWTPLHRAAYFGHKETAKFLIDKGADVNVRTNIGVLPIMMAIMHNHNDTAEMLIANGVEKTIYVAAAQGDVEGVKVLLKKDTNLVNATASNDGWSAMHWAAYMDHPDVIKVLIENGANVNIREKKLNEATPLFWAVRKGSLDAAKLLIEDGADVKFKMKNGGSLLHNSRTFEAAQLLVDNGVDVNAKDENGMTPLHYIVDPIGIQGMLFHKNGVTARTLKADFEKHRGAAEKITVEIAELLITKGADINAKDEKGNTPLSIAKMAKNKALIKLLEKAGAKE
ncbi:MAG: ankyrin repeat domain-containing protein [Phycisphaerae bacterium]|nr:ankyrin repeat domain-containing protein [Phycisphaerae bacterium]MDD5380333.1 ankyrin repeat domain-containing protein [Phycisphaerae bacterium]